MTNIYLKKLSLIAIVGASILLPVNTKATERVVDIPLVTSLENYHVIPENEWDEWVQEFEALLYADGYFVSFPSQEHIEFISFTGEQRVPMSVTYAPHQSGIRNLSTFRAAGGTRVRFNVATNVISNIHVGVLDSATNRVTWASSLTGTVTLPAGNVRDFTLVVRNDHSMSININVTGGAYVNSLMAFGEKLILVENPILDWENIDLNLSNVEMELSK